MKHTKNAGSPLLACGLSLCFLLLLDSLFVLDYFLLLCSEETLFDLVAVS